MAERRRFFKKLIFSREAVLFDAPLFVLKTFIALLCGYAIFKNHGFISKGMISLMLGIVLTLEPVNISGLRNGLDQITASLIGGVITVIVVLIGGVNIITVPLAVTITLYVTLLIDWRRMSIMAVFTSFYLTQAIIYTEAGQPDVVSTFGLRMLALGSGVLIAVIINFMFSLFFYKQVFRKRTIFIVEQTIGYLREFVSNCETKDKCNHTELKKKIILNFRDIDVIKSRLLDMRREKEGSIRVEDYTAVLEEMRDFNHYLLDFVMLSVSGELEAGVFLDLSSLIDSLESLRNLLIGRTSEWQKGECGCSNANIIRMQDSLLRISKII
ncbi:MAG: hypothetical protein JW903_01910 [Clostridia bacterium]|nr:hypothetical protein [Clostridia bacterium]